MNRSASTSKRKPSGAACAAAADYLEQTMGPDAYPELHHWMDAENRSRRETKDLQLPPRTDILSALALAVEFLRKEGSKR